MPRRSLGRKRVFRNEALGQGGRHAFDLNKDCWRYFETVAQNFYNLFKLGIHYLIYGCPVVPRRSSRSPAAGFASAAGGSLHAAPGPTNSFLAKGPRAKGNRSGKAKADIVVAVAGRVVVAIRRPAVQRIEVPAAAAYHAVGAPGLIDPDSSIIRRAVVVIVPVILHPLVDVAMHVVEAIGVGLFLT